MRRSAVSDAFMTCEAIAADRALATMAGDFADGYRAAANDIARAIRAKRYRREPAQLARELHDTELEARTLARIVEAAAEVVADACELQTPTAAESTTTASAVSGAHKDVA